MFQLAYKLWRPNALHGSDQDELRALLDWFDDHLAKPERFSPSRYPRAKNTAISWIRASSYEHMTKLRRLAALLEASGVQVNELRTRRPGYIVYEDDQQVVALPFADTPR